MNPSRISARLTPVTWVNSNAASLSSSRRGSHGLRNAGRTSFPPDDPELLFREGILLQQHRTAGIRLNVHTSSCSNTAATEHLFEHRPRMLAVSNRRHNLAAVYQDMGRLDLAELQWRQRRWQKCRRYRLGWHRLMDSEFLELGRTQAAALEIEHMLHVPNLRGTGAGGLLLSAQRAESLGELAAARRDISAAIEENPADSEPLEAFPL